MELRNQPKHGLELEFVLWSGQCGIAGMILFLTIQNVLLFCRSSTELRTGSTLGRFFFQKTSGDLWILDAHD
jgi:hypothetical protein